MEVVPVVANYIQCVLVINKFKFVFTLEIFEQRGIHVFTSSPSNLPANSSTVVTLLANRGQSIFVATFFCSIVNPAVQPLSKVMR